MTAMTRTVSGNHFRVLPRTLSIDDVMRMVDTEDGDILVQNNYSHELMRIFQVLTELSREDESSISDETHMTRTVSTTSSADDNSSQVSEI